MYNDVWILVEMERWSVQHRIVAVELFIKTESVTATQHGFQQQFQGHDGPSRNTLLSKWCQEGSVKTVNHKDVQIRLIHLTMWSR
jgi:hypothetical protein